MRDVVPHMLVKRADTFQPEFMSIREIRKIREIQEQLEFHEQFKDKNPHVYKHLQSSKACKDSCDDSCFKVIDSAKTYHQLKIKEALHILWEGPKLSKQVKHYNFSLTF